MLHYAVEMCCKTCITKKVDRIFVQNMEAVIAVVRATESKFIEFVTFGIYCPDSSDYATMPVTKQRTLTSHARHCLPISKHVSVFVLKHLLFRKFNAQSRRKTAFTLRKRIKCI